MRGSKRVPIFLITVAQALVPGAEGVPQVVTAKPGEEILIIDLNNHTATGRRSSVSARPAANDGASNHGSAQSKANVTTGEQKGGNVDLDALALNVLRQWVSENPSKGSRLPEALILLARQADKQATPLKEVPDARPEGADVKPPTKPGQMIVRRRLEGTPRRTTP